MNGLFIWIPKTAGTSISQALYIRRFVGDIEAMSAFNNKGLVTFGHASIPALADAGIVSREYLNSAFKFSFVRNPFDRMVSLYHHFLRREKIKKGFERFCERMMENKDQIGPYNYKGFSQALPQITWISPDVDFVGKFEDLQADLDIICARLELPRVKVKRTNESRRKNVAAYYNRETENIVGEIYANDFEMFGYERGVNGG